MPSYDFRCTACAQTFEARRGMFDPDPPCPRCGGVVAKVILSAPAVHGSNSLGREQAVRALPECGKGCRCCP